MSGLNQGRLFPSVTNQNPLDYWTLKDDFPQYIQIQRTVGKISGSSVNFLLNAFDPNMFIRSKAYIKLSVNIRKEIVNQDNDNVDLSDFTLQDRIYRKPGLVLANSCTNCTLRLNSHNMVYDDLRYIQNKLDTSFAGKKINNTYFTTSGGSFEDLNGIYDEYQRFN